MKGVWQDPSAVSVEDSISFSEQDLEVFSKASRDRNPLHLSQDYARRTAYGQQVVFGCLGAVACLGRISLPDGMRVTSLQADFLRPMFLGVSYRVETSEKAGTLFVRLFDGSLPVISLSLTIGPADSEVPKQTFGTAFFGRQEPAVHHPAEIVPGLSVSGKYAADQSAVTVLLKRWGHVDRFLTTILSLSSYLVGMELPGESALFSKIALNFDETVQHSGKLEYRASVVSFDSRFNRARMEVTLYAGARTIASGHLWSFVQSTVPEIVEKDLTEVRSDSLSTRVAVLIGASRGLGAAMKQALELRGAVVYSMARSASSGEAVPRMEVGDASDTAALKRLRERVLGEQGRLDFLICNACPPILPLRLEANATERLGSYINQAVSLTLAPLCSFLDLLNASDGCAVIISSLAVKNPVREWPHYLAAKQAVEMLAQVASLQYPRIHTLIVRPPKLLTTLSNTPLTNTPMDRLGAVSPALLADRLATRLEDLLEPGKLEIFA